MAVNDLENQLQKLNLAQDDYLLFHPPENIRHSGATFGNTPRYLFRVFTPWSQGSTSSTWVRSMDAKNGTADSTMDLFSRPPALTAQKIHRHLQGWGLDDDRDNLVSWTSSLLFALVYIFYLRVKISPEMNFDNIEVCVIDTSSFPDGVFVRDLDLIHAYRLYFKKLQLFENLRNRQRDGFQGYYYFGEYLSQGALKIEGKCRIVSAQNIIDHGLYNIRSEFRQYAYWTKASWANPVVEMRELFKTDFVNMKAITATELQSALNIADIFGSRWKLPIAAHLVALVAPRIDETVLARFRSFTDNARQECSPLRTRIAAYHTLPEVQRYETIMQSIYKDYCFTQFRSLLKDATDKLHLATALMEEMFPGNQDISSANIGWRTANLYQLYKIISLGDKLHNNLKAKEKSALVKEDGVDGDDNKTEEEGKADVTN
ncbi:hypothetical protein V8C35DRAFT_308686 [Trichoderma chlorosporum]